MPALKVSIPSISTGASDNNQQLLINLTKAIAGKLGREVEVIHVPFGHSLEYVKSGKVDFHLPLIKPKEVKKFPYIYSDATIYHVNFVLYLHKDSKYRQGKYSHLSIETERSHQAYIPFKTKASTCILCSLRRVQMGLIDGYLFADTSTDPVLLENKAELSDVIRKLYQVYEVKVIFPKTRGGNKLNKQVSVAIDSMRNNGKLAELLIGIDQPFKQAL